MLSGQTQSNTIPIWNTIHHQIFDNNEPAKLLHKFNFCIMNLAIIPIASVASWNLKQYPRILKAIIRLAFLSYSTSRFYMEGTMYDWDTHLLFHQKSQNEKGNIKNGQNRISIKFAYARRWNGLSNQ